MNMFLLPMCLPLSRLAAQMNPGSRRGKASYVIPNLKAKLLDQLREALRVKHDALRSEEA